MGITDYFKLMGTAAAQVGINIYILAIAMICLFIVFIVIKWVKSTIGFSFLFFLWKARNKKDHIILKIWLLNSRPKFLLVPMAERIEYTYKENGKEKTGIVFYDFYSKYEDFAGIPVLECSPSDSLPRNPFVSSSLTIPGDLVKKNITDSSKETTQGDNIKQMIKIALPLVIVVGIIIILYSSNQNDQVAEITQKLVACYQQTQSATIIAN